MYVSRISRNSMATSQSTRKQVAHVFLSSHRCRHIWRPKVRRQVPVRGEVQTRAIWFGSCGPQRCGSVLRSSISSYGSGDKRITGILKSTSTVTDILYLAKLTRQRKVVSRSWATISGPSIRIKGTLEGEEKVIRTLFYSHEFIG